MNGCDDDDDDNGNDGARPGYDGLCISSTDRLRSHVLCGG